MKDVLILSTLLQNCSLFDPQEWAYIEKRKNYADKTYLSTFLIFHRLAAFINNVPNVGLANSDNNDIRNKRGKKDLKKIKVTTWQK